MKLVIPEITNVLAAVGPRARALPVTLAIPKLTNVPYTVGICVEPYTIRPDGFFILWTRW